MVERLEKETRTEAYMLRGEGFSADFNSEKREVWKEDMSPERAYMLGLKRSSATDDPADITTNDLGSCTEDVVAMLDSLDRGDSSVHSFLYLDVDDFERVNTRYGRGTGNGVLRMLKAKIAANIGDSAAVYKVREDEFLVSYPDTRIANAAKAALSLDREISGQMPVVDDMGLRSNCRVEFSGGVYELRADDDCMGLYRKKKDIEGDSSAVDLVIERARRLSGIAKREGKNNITCAYEKTHSSLKRHLSKTMTS